MNDRKTGTVEVIQQFGQKFPGRKLCVVGVTPKRQHLITAHRLGSLVTQVTQPAGDLTGLLTGFRENHQTLSHGPGEIRLLTQMLAEVSDADPLIIKAGVDTHFLEADQFGR